MHTLASDLIVIWIGAIVFAFVAFMAWGFSIHDNGIEDKIGCALSPVILIAALIITVLQCVGVVSVW